MNTRIAPKVLRPRDHAGFTLIEVLIAVALMAVLAVLCWRGLDSVIQGRDRITRASDELRALTVAFAQLEDDLRRSWPIRLYNLPQRSITFALASDNAPVSLELLREASSIEEPLQVQRVIYRLRGAQLERGFAPWSAPTPDGATRVSEVPITWQPLLADVSVIEIRAWVERAGWVDAAALTPEALARAGAQGAAGQTTGVISGIEFALARTNGGRIVRVFAVKD